ncbi:hypothetical protein EBZ39_13195 [bacterium]|nr:hypothetical protein [bacterium]
MSIKNDFVLNFKIETPWVKDVIAQAILEMDLETLNDPEKQFLFIIARVQKAWENINKVRVLK